MTSALTPRLERRLYTDVPCLRNGNLILERETLCGATRWAVIMAAVRLGPYCALRTEKGTEWDERLLLSCSLQGERSVARPVLCDKRRVS